MQTLRINLSTASITMILDTHILVRKSVSKASEKEACPGQHLPTSKLRLPSKASSVQPLALHTRTSMQQPQLLPNTGVVDWQFHQAQALFQTVTPSDS